MRKVSEMDEGELKKVFNKLLDVKIWEEETRKDKEKFNEAKMKYKETLEELKRAIERLEEE